VRAARGLQAPPLPAAGEITAPRSS